MVCKNCGGYLSQFDKVCPSCGEKIEQPAVMPQTNTMNQPMQYGGRGYGPWGFAPSVPMSFFSSFLGCIMIIVSVLVPRWVSWKDTDYDGWYDYEDQSSGHMGLWTKDQGIGRFGSTPKMAAIALIILCVILIIMYYKMNERQIGYGLVRFSALPGSQFYGIALGIILLLVITHSIDKMDNVYGPWGYDIRFGLSFYGVLAGLVLLAVRPIRCFMAGIDFYSGRTIVRQPGLNSYKNHFYQNYGMNGYAQMNPNPQFQNRQDMNQQQQFNNQNNTASNYDGRFGR